MMENNESDFASQPPQGFLRRHRVAIIVLAVVAVLILALVRFVHHRQAQQQQAAATNRGFRPRLGNGAGGPGGPGGGGGMNGPVAVSVATVKSGDIAVRIPALGTITPLATVTVKSQISGQLQKILFKEGQLVQAGDPLALIDPRPYEAALAQAEGNLKRDQALLVDAKLDLKRYEDLITQDSVAEQQVDTQRYLVDQYVGTVASDQAAIKSAQVNLIYCHITSPVAGRVGLRQVDQGNYVTPGDANGIVVVTELQPISAIFPIPEDNVTKVMQRLHEGATLTAEAYDRTNSAKLSDGKVLTLDNQIDVTTGTVKLRALFDNKDNTLFPNQFVNIQLVVEDLKNQTVMPNAAVHRGAPNGVTSTFVYLVNADSTVSVRPVTLGVVDGENVAVTAGVTPGAVVVTEGGDRLRDGAPVQLPEAPVRAAGAPGTPAAQGATPGATGPGGAHPRGAGRHKWQQGQQPQGRPPAPAQ
jgi:membrane fusion protein, multidrug efflux system